MKARLLKIAIAIAGLSLGMGTLALAQGPGGPPHGNPPPGMPPGMQPGGQPGGPGGPPGPSNAGPQPSGSRASSATSRSSQQFGPVGRWWDDRSVVKTVGIGKEQQKKMDAIFDANKPAILESYKKFLSEQSALDKINKDPKSDQATIFAAIDAVSKARASLQKATAQMLLEIRQQMNADQISKLEKLQ
jgi:Spy/CpxP family protein refolding chaperone